jgi:hypothetical protein
VRHASARGASDQRIADVISVRVNRGWRILHPTERKVYESGAVVDLDILPAAEWSGWGSVRPIHGTFRTIEAA